MRADRLGKLIQGLRMYARAKFGDVTIYQKLSGRSAIIFLTFGRFILLLQIDKAYLSSASSKGPVDTGFTYCTLCSLLWKARASTVEKIVFPTPVFAP